MTDLFIPPWVRISGGRYDFVSQTTAASSIFTGATQTLDRTGDRVGVAFRTDNASHRESAPTRAFLSALRARMRGQGRRIWYTDPGYVPRGSFPASELLSNNTFESGTTGWDASSGEVSISVQDRMLRSSKASGHGSTSFALTTLANVTGLTQYAPYVMRFFARQGRGTYSSLVAWDQVAAAAIGSNVTSFGLISGVSVINGTTIRPALHDNTGAGQLAGDFIDISYTSLSRCALIDNGPNQFTQSDDLSHADWNHSSVTSSANYFTAPDGTITGDKLIETTATAGHSIHQDETKAATAQDWCLGGEFRSGDLASARTRVCLRIQDTSATDYVQAIFDLSNGTVVSSSVNGTGANVRPFIVSLGNGWYACYVVGRTDAETTVRGRVLMVQSGTTVSYTGQTTSDIGLRRLAFAQSSVPVRLSQTTTATVPSGATQTGPGYYTKGWPASTNGLLLTDDWVQIGNQLNKVVAPVNSDAAGLAYLQLAYPQRFEPSDNAPVIIHQPMGRFVAVSNQGGYDFRPGGLSDHEFELVEALDQAA